MWYNESRYSDGNLILGAAGAFIAAIGLTYFFVKEDYEPYVAPPSPFPNPPIPAPGENTPAAVV